MTDNWRDHAECRGTNPALFIPERGDNNGFAKAICAICPSKQPCLEYAIAHNEPGVWGGTTPRERDQIRRRRRNLTIIRDTA